MVTTLAVSRQVSSTNSAVARAVVQCVVVGQGGESGMSGKSGEAILDAGKGSSGDTINGLLVSLLTIFDTDNDHCLNRDEFEQAATPLGFDTSAEAWATLVERFGDKISKGASAGGDTFGDRATASRRAAAAVAAPTADEDGAPVVEQESLDLSLLGAYFANKYDSLLEGLLRRLMRGIIYTNQRNADLESRLRIVEEHLEQTSMRTMRERQSKINKTLRRWRHQYTSVAFDTWKKMVDQIQHLRKRTMRHWANQVAKAPPPATCSACLPCAPLLLSIEPSAQAPTPNSSPSPRPCWPLIMSPPSRRARADGFASVAAMAADGV